MDPCRVASCCIQSAGSGATFPGRETNSWVDLVSHGAGMETVWRSQIRFPPPRTSCHAAAKSVSQPVSQPGTRLTNQPASQPACGPQWRLAPLLETLAAAAPRCADTSAETRPVPLWPLRRQCGPCSPLNATALAPLLACIHFDEVV